VPNQFASNLSPQEAYAACGPAAAVALARYLGRNPTVAEALQLARQTGWTLNGGMNGIANEQRLLAAMHIRAQIEMPVNWRHIQLEAGRGTPVIVSTPNHYWVIDDYDPVTREYHVGQSGLVYRGGAEWMSAERIQQLGGGLSGGLYINHPLAAAASPTVQVALDQGWRMAAHHAVVLDPGWTKGDGLTAAPVAVHAQAPVAAEPAPEQVPPVAAATAADRWWEDAKLIRSSVVAAPEGPKWI
jgi:hypothetical protein